MPPPNCKPKVVASSKDADDIKQVASFLNWHDYDRLMGRVFYEKFGRVLEEKLAEFENRKRQLKDCIRRNFGLNNTPKQLRTVTPLIQQICDLKKLAISSSDCESEDVDEGFSTSDMDTVHKSVAEDEVTKEENMGVDVTESIIRHVAQKKPQLVDKNRGKLSKSEHQQPISKAVGNKNEPPISRDAFVQYEIQKELKLNALRKKAADANLQREAFLRDKATRTRREREERIRRVEEKRRAEEQKKNERDLQLFEHQERVRFFAAQQKLPFHTAFGNQTTPATNCKKTPARTKRQPNQAKIASVKTASIMNGNDVDNQENVKFVPQTTTPSMAQPKKMSSITLIAPIATKKLPLLIASTINSDLSGSGNATYNIQQHSTNAKGNLFPTDPSVGTSQSRSTATQQQPKKKPTADVHVSQVMTSTPKLNAPPINPDNEIEMTPLPRLINSPISPCDDITKANVSLPSSDEDYNINDLSSADETDDDQCPRKTVPNWAQKEGMRKHSAFLIKNITLDRMKCYFGPIQQPLLDQFFQNIRKKTVRKSSAIWNSPLSDPTPGEGKYDQLFDNKVRK